MGNSPSHAESLGADYQPESASLRPLIYDLVTSLAVDGLDRSASKLI